jgi:hypothetical protein
MNHRLATLFALVSSLDSALSRSLGNLPASAAPLSQAWDKGRTRRLETDATRSRRVLLDS